LEDRLYPELHDALLKWISLTYLNHSTHRYPKAVILAGQPGAGKSHVREEVAKSMDKDVVIIDPDELRNFHPRYKKHSNEDSKTSASKVQHDASLWASELRRLAIGKRNNVIIDGTLSNPEKADMLCAELKNCGYEVEVVALAVNEEVSWQGVKDRYESAEEASAKDSTIIPRWVPKEIHDSAYKGMPESLELIERKRMADRIKVCDRDYNLLYESNLENPESPMVMGASKALREGRLKTEQEKAQMPEESSLNSRSEEGIDENRAEAEQALSEPQTDVDVKKTNLEQLQELIEKADLEVEEGSQNTLAALETTAFDLNSKEVELATRKWMEAQDEKDQLVREYNEAFEQEKAQMLEEESSLNSRSEEEIDENQAEAEQALSEPQKEAEEDASLDLDSEQDASEDINSLKNADREENQQETTDENISSLKGTENESNEQKDQSPDYSVSPEEEKSYG
jgi:predicted ABC-type ATPase